MPESVIKSKDKKLRRPSGRAGVLKKALEDISALDILVEMVAPGSSTVKDVEGKDILSRLTKGQHSISEELFAGDAKLTAEQLEKLADKAGEVLSEVPELAEGLPDIKVLIPYGVHEVSQKISDRLNNVLVAGNTITLDLYKNVGEVGQLVNFKPKHKSGQPVQDFVPPITGEYAFRIVSKSGTKFELKPITFSEAYETVNWQDLPVSFNDGKSMSSTMSGWM